MANPYWQLSRDLLAQGERQMMNVTEDQHEEAERQKARKAQKEERKKQGARK